MKIFVQWEEDPTSIMQDIATAVVIGTQDDEDCNEVHRWMRSSFKAAPGFGYCTFLFVRHRDANGQWSDVLELDSSYPGISYKAFMLPSPKSTTLQPDQHNFDFNGLGFTGLYDTEENTFCFQNLHAELRSGFNALSSLKSKASGCKHQKGMTPINGHGICKKCGIDLD